MGRRIRRTRWHHQVYVVAQAGYPDGIEINRNTASALGIDPGTICYFGPYLMQMCADGVLHPWMPDQADLFGNDWGIAPPSLSRDTPYLPVPPA